MGKRRGRIEGLSKIRGVNLIDLTGSRHGLLTVLSVAEPYTYRRGDGIKRISQWRCRCDCGTELTVRQDWLRGSRVAQCEACRPVAPRPFRDLAGQQFGRWTAIERLPLARKGIDWLCECTCGARAVVGAGQLTSGMSRSCGCLKNDVAAERWTTHGMTKTGTYRSWMAMKARCEYASADPHRRYGGRGISVCDRWRYSFAAFLADMGERPPGKTIDRIDPDGNYEPNNCRWATRVEQGRNTRRSVSLDEACEVLGRVEYGEKRRSIARRLGVSLSTVNNIVWGKVWRELDRSTLARR